MDSGEKRYREPCYIGSTKFMAGIFLSRKIAESKPYADSLELQAYDTYADAERAFFDMYEEWIDKNEFYVNKLFDVRKRNVYAAVCIPEGAGVFEMENMSVFFRTAVGRGINIFSDTIVDDLTYEEATKKVKVFLSKPIGKFRVEMYGQPKVNRLITWHEATKRRNMTGIYDK